MDPASPPRNHRAAADTVRRVIDTRQTSGGFRQILQQHVPTSRDIVQRRQHELVTAAAGSGTSRRGVPRGG